MVVSAARRGVRLKLWACRASWPSSVPPAAVLLPKPWLAWRRCVVHCSEQSLPPLGLVTPGHEPLDHRSDEALLPLLLLTD